MVQLSSNHRVRACRWPKIEFRNTHKDVWKLGLGKYHDSVLFKSENKQEVTGMGESLGV